MWGILMNKIINMKILMVAALAIGLSTPTIAGPKGEQGSSHGQPFLALQAQIDQTNADLDALAADNAASITALETSVANLQSDVVGLQNQIDSNDMDIADLQDAAGDNTDAIAALVTENADLQTQLDALTDEVATKQDLLDGNGACPNGYSIRVINPDGSYMCEYDNTGSSYASQLIYYSSWYSVYRNPYQTYAYIYCPYGYKVTGGGMDAYYGGYGRSVAAGDSRPITSSYYQGWYIEASGTTYSYYGNWVRSIAMCVRHYN